MGFPEPVGSKTVSCDDIPAVVSVVTLAFLLNDQVGLTAESFPRVLLVSLLQKSAYSIRDQRRIIIILL